MVDNELREEFRRGKGAPVFGHPTKKDVKTMDKEIKRDLLQLKILLIVLLLFIADVLILQILLGVLVTAETVLTLKKRW